MHERRRATDGFEERLSAVEHNVSQLMVEMETHNKQAVGIEAKLDRIMHDTELVREIMAESRAAFKFAERIAEGIRKTVKIVIWVTAPGLVIALGVTLVKGGSPPHWVKEWVDLFR